MWETHGDIFAIFLQVYPTSHLMESWFMTMT